MSEFSFVENAVNRQSPARISLIATYELGRVIENWHKSQVYGPQGYLNGMKQEMADFVAMIRMYCEQSDIKLRLTPRAVPFSEEHMLLVIVSYVGYLSTYVVSSQVVVSLLADAIGWFCYARGWSEQELFRLGEEHYLERMKDIKEHGR